ncbi:hypothetical protein [uncultured Paraglaciecola sp.]|uniref:hypothetical protein n=1 Tax=uncultured Paraglaciecola sp. TaxID=1765024 RepID=UPI00261744AE|nr:hypothetical protein [uncultured Paraglaciecola sp.]
MSRQPPEDSLQFGRQNRVRLAADIANAVITQIADKVQKESGVTFIRQPWRDRIESKRAIGKGPGIDDALLSGDDNG